ncbi:MAG: DUF3817 domain-containing protein [Bacteroidota bacterium]
MNAISILRKLGIVEGISYLLLLGIAMPLKYMADMPWAVTYVGWAHGLLFMLYLVTAAWVILKYKWPILRFVVAFFAALLPFGPFVWDRYLKRYEADMEGK